MTKTKIGIGIVALVAVLVVALAGTALAQEGTPPATPSPDSQQDKGHGIGPGGPGRRGGPMIGKPVEMEAAAEALGMTVDELSTQLWGGKTLAELAEEAGVDLQAIRDAAEAAQKAAQKDAIEQAVTDDKMSREQADWLLEGLDKGYWGSHGGSFGFGGRGGPRGFGGRPGRGGFGAPPDKTAPDSGESDGGVRSAPPSPGAAGL
ncbi:MAG: hypothetical protein JW850_22210 [Thermoflexales bacterium]|nr:hypothetical protein [Thermoflexales bacterium]